MIVKPQIPSGSPYSSAAQPEPSARQRGATPRGGVASPGTTLSPDDEEGRWVSTVLEVEVDLRGGSPRVEEVGDGLFAYVQPDGSWNVNNTGFLVGPDGVTSVDTCSTERRTRVYLDAVARVTPWPVRTLLNTHHRPDHTAGNGLLPGATIVAQDAAR